MATYKLKRVYDEPAKADGYRVLVDRLWPRGLSKQKAALDLWHKDIAPSSQLRIWFGHKSERFTEFSAHYEDELSHNSAVAKLKTIAKEHGLVTLLYAAKDPAVNHAKVLKAYLES